MARKLMGVVPTLYEMPERERKKKFEWAILAVAILLLAKAEILFSIVAVAAGHAANVLPAYFLQPIVELFTEQRFLDQDPMSDKFLWLILLFAVFYAAIGTGLLIRLSWSRLTVIAVSGLEVIALFWFTIVPAMEQQSTLALESQVLLVVILIADFASIVILLRHSKSFEHRNNRIFEGLSK
jgi:hypothetical protein